MNLNHVYYKKCIAQVGPRILVLGKKPQKYGLGKSLFTRLLGQYGSQLEVAVLNTNHRCHEDIVSLARSLFYCNDLKVADGFKPIRIPGVSCPIWFVCSSLQMNDTQLVNKDTNSDEAKALIQQLQVIFKGTKQLDDVCIMTTNRNQVINFVYIAYLQFYYFYIIYSYLFLKEC